MCLRNKSLEKWFDSAKTPNFAIVKKFLCSEDPRQTSIERQVFTGFSAIHYAVLAGQEANVQLLISQGELYKGSGQVQLIYSPVLKAMFELPAGSVAASVALLTSTNQNLITALINDQTVTKYQADDDGINLLMMMVVCDQPDLISSTLVQHLFDKKDVDGKNILDYCALLGRYDCLKKILSYIQKDQLQEMIQKQQPQLKDELERKIPSLFQYQVNESAKQEIKKLFSSLLSEEKDIRIVEPPEQSNVRESASTETKPIKDNNT